MPKLFQYSLRSRISFLVFLLLSISFTAYLFINTRVNNSLYSVELNQKIHTTVIHNVAKIDRYTSSMQQKTADLAFAGEAFYRMRDTTGRTSSDDEIIKYLVDNFKTFPEAIGGGLWFEPYTFKANQKYYGPYVYWAKDKVVFTWDLNTPKYDYLTQSWYTIALPVDWNRKIKRDKQFYWTAPYFDDAGTQSLMITVDAFMYDDKGVIIGISTADWSTRQMLTFLEESKISSDSHLFLVDGNFNIVLANTLDVQSVLKEASDIWWIDKLVNPEKEKIKEVSLTISGTQYNTYYTLTEAGMFYGVLIPYEVIVGPLDTLFKLNLMMLLILMLFLLITLYIILSSVTNPIIKLTQAAQRVSEGDLLTQISTTSKDEIGTLSNVFRLMQNNIREAQSDLKVKVQEKTEQLSLKVTEVELSNKAIKNLLEDIEEEKKKVEETVVVRTKELNEEKARLLASINSLPVGFALADKDDNILFKNQVFQSTFALMGSDITKMEDIIDAFSGITNLKEAHRQCIEEKRLVEIESVFFKNKFFRIILAPVIMLHNSQEVIGHLFLVEDITEAKVMERSKDEFFAVASHELRTPLTAIRGNAEMILDMYGDKIVDKDVKEMLADINEASVRLIGIVNDFLDVSRLEQGKISLKNTSFDVAEIIENVINSVQNEADEKNLLLQFIKPENIHTTVFADSDKVKQILFNLIGNSIKFTSKGSVTVSISVAGGFVAIKVADTGVGISLQNENLLFRKFQPAGEHILARDVTSSTGLGLYISSLLVYKMRGSIGLEKSELGKGSVFFFTLPIAS